MGNAEPFKAVVHGIAATVLGLMAVYNGMTWWQARRRGLALNTVVYTGMVAYEIARVREHLHTTEN